MLTASDLLRLPYTPDLTEGGIAFALRSLTYAFERDGASPYNQLRRMAANTAVELAFRRHLSQNEIPFEVKTATPFTDRERFDVVLDGHRCDIKSFLISYREQATQIRRDPSMLLNVPALVPSDTHAGEGHAYNDLYLFSFMTGLVTQSQIDLQKVIAKGLPHHLVHVMPKAWRHPAHWTPLGALTLKSESAEELLLEISGQDEGRELKRMTISLPPKTKVKVDGAFYTITSLHVRRIPEARVGIRCEARTETYLIAPADWANLWVYGMDIFMAGYLNYEEFGQRARMLPPNSQVFQYARTKTKNLFVQVADLKPMRKLLNRHPR